MRNISVWHVGHGGGRERLSGRGRGRGGGRGGRLQRRAALHALAHERRAGGARGHVAARPEHHRGRRLRAHHALAHRRAGRHARAAYQTLFHLRDGNG